MAPGSSGFGKETVRKAPSGSACAGSTATPSKPARARARMASRWPTPCIAV